MHSSTGSDAGGAGVNIAAIRKEHGVPAKAGMVVVVKSGEHRGEQAIILGADRNLPGYLKIRDASGRRKLLWWRRVHPTELEYNVSEAAS